VNLCKDGRIIPLQISFGGFTREGRRYFTGIAHDITQRKQVEHALRESEERYRLVADMIPQNIWTTDAEGHHTYFSRGWYEYSGATPEQSLGHEWIRFMHPDDRERTRARWRHSVETGEPGAARDPPPAGRANKTHALRRSGGEMNWSA
jgi:PAS domain-containing protein